MQADHQRGFLKKPADHLRNYQRKCRRTGDSPQHRSYKMSTRHMAWPANSCHTREAHTPTMPRSRRPRCCRAHLADHERSLQYPGRAWAQQPGHHGAGYVSIACGGANHGGSNGGGSPPWLFDGGTNDGGGSHRTYGGGTGMVI